MWKSALFSRWREPCHLAAPDACSLEPPPCSHQAKKLGPLPAAGHSEGNDAGLSWEMACPLQPGVPSQPSWLYPVPGFTFPVPSLPLSFWSTDLLCGLRPFLPSASPLYLHRPFSLQISCISILRGPKLVQVINQSSLRKWGVTWGCEIGLFTAWKSDVWETWNSQTFWVMFRAWVILGTGWAPSASLQQFRWLEKPPSEGDPLVGAIIQHLKIRGWNGGVCRGSGVNWLLFSCSSALLRRQWNMFHVSLFCEKPGPLTSS